MWPRLTVFRDPRIQVSCSSSSSFLAQGNTVELVEHGLVEALAMPLVCGLLVLVRE